MAKYHVSDTVLADLYWKLGNAQKTARALRIGQSRVKEMIDFYRIPRVPLGRSVKVCPVTSLVLGRRLQKLGWAGTARLYHVSVQTLKKWAKLAGVKKT